MKPIARKENIVVHNADNETLVYDLNLNKAFLLNETSAFIWNLCDGKHDINQIRVQVEKKFKQSATEDFIWLAIDQLNKDSLIENFGELPNHFQGLNRREVIKRVGLATMISLPFITSITAPKAVNATSNAACIGDSGDCIDLGNSTQSNCCSGLRCLGGAGFCLACRTSSSLPYVQFNSLTDCQNSLARNLCCDPSAPVTFTPANPPFSTVGSCFCG
jgi:hypothetical protein